jgi:formylglycine-generating enzyme required for sulfatase activity
MKAFLVLLLAFTIFFVSNCSKSPTKTDLPNPTITPTPKDTMILIDNGGFSIGSSAVGGMGSDESPSHPVNLSPYFIDTIEVTQSEYFSLTQKNPSYFNNDSLKPVENVTWFDAVLFCNARSKRDRFDSVYSYDSIVGNAYNGCSNLINLQINYTKNGYRLPTEAEWENGCRSETNSIFYWGNGTSTRADTLAADSNAVYYNNSYKLGAQNSAYGTHAVASLKPNPSGLYDMSGNVLEWCNDYYGNYVSGEQTNPSGPSSGTEKVLRGGSWGNPLANIRSASRYRMLPQNKSYFAGFRCVRAKLN